MNLVPFPPIDPASAPPRTRRRVVLITISVVCLVILGGITALALSFVPGQSVRTLRRAALRAEPAAWDRQIEFGVGRLPTFLARTALRAVDLPPEARAAINALHCADVGIYHRRGTAPSPSPETTLAQVRDAMEQDGWQPMVLVQDGTDTVAVFVPSQPSPRDTQVSAAIFVMNRTELVVVSARADLEPVLEILPSHGSALPTILARR